MPFQPINFAYVQPQGNPGIKNLVESLLTGYKAGREPTKIKQEETGRDLVNQLNKYKADFEPERQRLFSALTSAQTQKALRPPQPTMSNFEKAMAGAERVKQQYGEDSGEYKLAQSYLQRLAQGSGTQLSVDPATGAVTFSQGSGGRGGGTMQWVDGKLVQTPTTPTRTSQQKGSLANVVREEMAKHISNPYLGTGSNKKLIQDRILYEKTTDPKKKKEIGDRLVSAAVSMKLVPEYAGAQLAAQGITATVPGLQHQTEAITQGWAEGLPLAVKNLPPELQTLAKERHDAAIEAINNVRNKFVSQGLPIDLNKGEEPKIVGSKVYNGKTYLQGENGEWYEK